MGATLEITSGIIRFGASHTSNFTPYAGAVCLDPADRHIAVLKGASGILKREDLADIAKVLLAAGFTIARWQRLRRDGGWKEVEVDLERYR